jgi:hypothetical protein
MELVSCLLWWGSRVGQSYYKTLFMSGIDCFVMNVIHEISPRLQAGDSLISPHLHVSRL